MASEKRATLETTALVLVFLMVALQLAYAVYAYADPAGFSAIRGTELVAAGDTDWVRIYASRTLFVTLIVGYLLYARHFRILSMAALFGIVMPVTDAWLAWQAHAADKVIIKHVATALFLAATFAVLRAVVKRRGGH
jgi:hypothetical protein